MTAFLGGVTDKVKGQIVLVGKSVAVPVNLNPPAKRRPDEEVRAQYDPNNPDGGRGRGRGRGNAGGDTPPGTLSTNEINRRVDEFLVANGARVRVNDAGREHGQIIAFNNRTFDVTKAVPTVVMRNEDYGRIARILADGTPVELEFNIVNKVYPEGRTSYNTIAEIPGSDKKDEIVMLGGHLDSWHSATGATDNAIGCAIMMEAARILKAIGVQPRRTIRVALWSGEEEGLLGSQAYVREHFGSFENPKPEYATLDAYLNIDSGTGHPRGAGVFGPPAAAAILRQTLAPFADLGVVGASATRSRVVGGTDSTVVQQRRAARHRLRSGSHRIQHAHPPHEPGQLRAHHRKRRQGRGRRHRGHALPARDARPDGAALRAVRHAAARATEFVSAVKGSHADELTSLKSQVTLSGSSR